MIAISAGKKPGWRQPRRIPQKTREPTAIHRDFLEFWERRTDLNQSIKALDFSQRLALHDLTLKPQLGARSLSEIYPGPLIPAFFDLSLNNTIRYLRESQVVLTEAAFLLAQPIYEQYLDAVIGLVAAAQRIKPTAARSLNKRHEWVASLGVGIEGTPQFELFDVLRLSRNALIHNGGVVDDQLAEARRALSKAAEGLWRQATKESLPAMNRGERLKLGVQAPIGMIYTVGNLGAQLNRELVSSKAIEDTRWAELIVFDFRRDPTAEQRWRMAMYWKDRFQLVRNHAEEFFSLALPNVVQKGNLLEMAVRQAPQEPVLP